MRFVIVLLMALLLAAIMQTINYFDLWGLVFAFVIWGGLILPVLIMVATIARGDERPSKTRQTKRI